MSHKITLNRPDDEKLEVIVDGECVSSVTHDSVGWAGMEAVEKLAYGLAEKLGIPVEETYGEDAA